MTTAISPSGRTHRRGRPHLRRPSAGGWLLGLVGALLGAAAAPVGAAAQFSVRPVIHHYPAGNSATRVVTVRNEADAARQLRIYVADFDRDLSGGHRFLPAGEHERSCAARIRVFPDQLRLEAGESADVRVTVEPGARTCWSVVFAETVDGGREGIRIGRRIGAKIFGHGSNARREFSVDSVTATPGADSVDVGFTVANDGDVPIRPEGTVEVRTVAGQVVGRRELRPFGVLPGRDRRVRVSVPARLAEGRHLAVPILDGGGDHLVGGQAAFRASAESPAGPPAGDR